MRYYAVRLRPGVNQDYTVLDDGTVWQGPANARPAVLVLYASGDGERVTSTVYDTEITTNGGRRFYHCPSEFRAVLGVDDAAHGEDVPSSEWSDCYSEQVRELHLSTPPEEREELCDHSIGRADVTAVEGDQ